MNKQAFAIRLSQQFGFSGGESEMMVERFFNSLSQALAQNRRVELRGLGVFACRLRQPSVGRVVRTGQAVKVPARRRVAFRPGKALKVIGRPAA